MISYNRKDIKIAFCASNTATRLKKFLPIASKQNIIKDIAFVLIDNKENAELRDICKKFNVPLIEKDMADIKDKGQYISDLFLEQLEKFDVGYAFIFCERILKGEILKVYENKIINFHPSILPSFKGLKAIDQALSTDAILLGNTAHFIDESVDAGKIIMQSVISRFDFNGYDSVLDLQLPMLLQIINWLKEGRVLIEGGHVKIKDANYKISNFIPNLENV